MRSQIEARLKKAQEIKAKDIALKKDTLRLQLLVLEYQEAEGLSLSKPVDIDAEIERLQAELAAQNGAAS